MVEQAKERTDRGSIPLQKIMGRYALQRASPTRTTRRAGLERARGRPDHTPMLCAMRDNCRDWPRLATLPDEIRAAVREEARRYFGDKGGPIESETEYRIASGRR